MDIQPTPPCIQCNICTWLAGASAKLLLFKAFQHKLEKNPLISHDSACLFISAQVREIIGGRKVDPLTTCLCGLVGNLLSVSEKESIVIRLSTSYSLCFVYCAALFVLAAEIS